MNNRRISKEICVGNLRIGGNNPIRIQTMANTDTNNIEASVAQAKRCLEAGTELLRYTTQGTKEAENLGKIKEVLRAEGIDLPLVADIHFNANVAEVAANLVEKVRINPGNFVTGKHGDYTDEEWNDELRRIREKLHTLLSICKDKGTAIRIGVNHGSLSPRIMSRYGNTPLGLATSCMEFIELCEQEGFTNLILSVKASNTRVMIYAVRMLVQMMDAKGKNYPLHLGVTEAGSDDEGRIKSAVGIGTLLHDGIGDTIRVSISGDPVQEVPAGISILHQTGKSEYENVRAAYLAAGCSEAETDAMVKPFLHDMTAAYRDCDLALCRAGATSMAELAATGTPAVFLPFPQAAHDHQTENARAMQEAGGGILIPQKDAQAMHAEGRLAPILIELLNDRPRLAAMREGALSLARPEAADAVAEEILRLANSN